MIKNLEICCINKNSIKFLPKFLPYWKKLTDHITIMDTGSTDGSYEWLKTQNVKVFQTEWNHDFAEARNKALKKCTKDNILVLDSDEYVPTQYVHEIRKALKKNHVAYLVSINNFTSDPVWRQPTVLPGMAVRLFKRCFTYSGVIHEKLDDLPQNIIPAEFPIYHMAYEHMGYITEKMEYYRRILTNSLKGKKSELNDFVHFAHTYREQYRYTGKDFCRLAAIDYLKRALECDPENKIIKNEIAMLSQVGKNHEPEKTE